jgi:DNA-directed RNA polymerase omega subunit
MVDEIMSRVKNKFVLVNATIARAKQVQAGSLPYVDDFDPTDPIKTALKELVSERIKIKIGKGAPKTLEMLSVEESGEKTSLAKEDKKKKKKEE